MQKLNRALSWIPGHGQGCAALASSRRTNSIISYVTRRFVVIEWHRKHVNQSYLLLSVQEHLRSIACIFQTDNCEEERIGFESVLAAVADS